MLGAIWGEISKSRSRLGSYKDLKRPQGMGREAGFQEALFLSPSGSRNKTHFMWICCSLPTVGDRDEVGLGEPTRKG